MFKCKVANKTPAGGGGVHCLGIILLRAPLLLSARKASVPAQMRGKNKNTATERRHRPKIRSQATVIAMILLVFENKEQIIISLVFMHQALNNQTTYLRGSSALSSRL